MDNHIKLILLAINSSLNKKFIFLNQNSLFTKELNLYYSLINEYSNEKMIFFLEKEKTHQFLLSKEMVEKIKIQINTKDLSLKRVSSDFDLSPEEFLFEFKKIEVVENNLPFKNFSSIVVDKKFLKEIDWKNYAEIRKSLIPVIQFMQEYQNKNLILNDLNVEFFYSPNKKK